MREARKRRKGGGEEEEEEEKEGEGEGDGDGNGEGVGWVDDYDYDYDYDYDDYDDDDDDDDDGNGDGDDDDDDDDDDDLDDGDDDDNIAGHFVRRCSNASDDSLELGTNPFSTATPRGERGKLEQYSQGKEKQREAKRQTTSLSSPFVELELLIRVFRHRLGCVAFACSRTTPAQFQNVYQRTAATPLEGRIDEMTN
ncbi:hypothetical protein HZH68_008194 [Vespula germanica]|uniref:Uncharacterized protein n=1 Tax=Vespula germanica TaxID=30212 RepID=A0A834N804_VESGE|nr:hypothetical protein HZH68_008194 [Vespula germanica]